jgi:hypothetical protein
MAPEQPAGIQEMPSSFHSQKIPKQYCASMAATLLVTGLVGTNRRLGIIFPESCAMLLKHPMQSRAVRARCLARSKSSAICVSPIAILLTAFGRVESAVSAYASPKAPRTQMTIFQTVIRYFKPR